MLDYLPLENINLEGKAKNRQKAIKEVADIFLANGYTSREYEYKMYQREELVSSYIGNKMVMPHGICSDEYIYKSGMVFIRYKDPIRWGRDSVNFIIAIAAKDSDTLYMANKVSKLSNMKNIVDILQQLETKEEFVNLIEDLS